MSAVVETKPAQEETKATDEVSAPEAAAPAAVVAAEASTAKEDEPKKEETEQEETEQEEPEEQNDLTRKFTAEEWKAVKELRVRLYLIVGLIHRRGPCSCSCSRGMASTVTAPRHLCEGVPGQVPRADVHHALGRPPLDGA